MRWHCCHHSVLQTNNCLADNNNNIRQKITNILCLIQTYTIARQNRRNCDGADIWFCRVAGMDESRCRNFCLLKVPHSNDVRYILVDQSGLISFIHRNSFRLIRFHLKLDRRQLWELPLHRTAFFLQPPSLASPPVWRLCACVYVLHCWFSSTPQLQFVFGNEIFRVCLLSCCICVLQIHLFSLRSLFEGGIILRNEDHLNWCMTFSK